MILVRIPVHNSGARIIVDGDRHFFFSNEDLVGYKHGSTKIRISTSHIGATMWRHMTELGVMEWHAYPEKEFDKIVDGDEE